MENSQNEPLFAISRVRSTKSSTVTRHDHNAYELYYLLDGERNYFVKDRTYWIKKGMLVFIGKYDLHSTFDADSPCHERVLISFKEDFISDWQPVRDIRLFDCFQHPCHAVQLGTGEQIQVEDLLSKMISENNKKGFGYELCIKTKLIELLLLLNRHIRQNPSDDFCPYTSQHKKVMEIVNYINNNYSEPQTLERLSGIFFLNPGYISRIFKQVTGFNFSKYVNHVRIKESIKLMQETQLSITRIASQTGFESPTHFGRVFKANTGQSPVRFRKGKRA